MSYHYISQISHVEVQSAAPDASVEFFTDVLGLQESHREGQSVWLRAWGEFFHHSLKITEGDGPGLVHAAWRVDGPDDLDLVAKALEDDGCAGVWIDGDVGHGPAYRVRVPGGQVYEFVWEVERFKPTPDLASVFPGRPQKQIAHNAAVRRLDHVTMQTRELQADMLLLTKALKFRYMEGTINAAGEEIFMTLTSGAQNHDLGLVAEPPDYDGPGGRYNHFCYYYDTREELLRAADILAENGHKLEHGPHKHGIGETFFAYVFEPGGNRVELHSAGYWNYIPDWEPILWRLEDGGNIAWQLGQFPVPGTPPPDTVGGGNTTLADLLGTGGVAAGAART